MKTMEHRTMGRIYKHDPSDAKYPMQSAIRKAPTVISRTWDTGPVLNQGKTSHCVGYAWRQWMTSAPLRTMDGPTPGLIYQRAQELDDIPDYFPYEGTTVRGGAKALEEQGRIEKYVWATSVDEVRDFILTTGSVVVGTNWYSRMSSTSLWNYAWPKGTLIGGHAYVLCGYSGKRDAFRMINSWGEGWGWNGRAWIKSKDLARLLEEDGEACAAIEKEVVEEL